MKPGAIGILALAGLGIGLAAASFLGDRPAFVWNFTPSAPIGLYRVLDRPWSRGDYVAVRPSPELARDLAQMGILKPGRFLVKRIAAIEGESVCRLGTTVTINGAVAADARPRTSAGHPLPAWTGCVTLGSDQVFLLGVAEGSYDGRYFGVTDATDIVTPIEHLALHQRNSE